MTGTTNSYKHFNVTFPAEYVAHVEINRAEKLNAFIEAMWVEYGKIIDSFNHDQNIRAIIVSGAGPRAFTAGLDIQAATVAGPLKQDDQLDPARKATSIRRHILEFQDHISSAERCEKPVIFAMHGYSMGLGIDMSCCGDIRLCAKDTKFAVKEVDIGLAADIGTLSRLPKVVGSNSWVKDVCLTARIFDAEEALRVGFVSGVYEDKAATLEAASSLATLIASKSPIAVQSTKDILNFSRDHNVTDGLKYVSVWNSAAIQTSDVTTAFAASLQKRKPRFEKL